MATQLFKDGVIEYVDAQYVTNMLAAGWSLDDPTVEKKLPEGVEILNQKEICCTEEEQLLILQGVLEKSWEDQGLSEKVEQWAPEEEQPVKIRKKPGRKPKAR